MDYEIIEKDPMLITGLELRTNNDQAAEDIPKLWDRFHKENILGFIPNLKSAHYLGLYCDYESDHTGSYTLIAAGEVTLAADIPKGFVLKQVPAGKYAMFKVSGTFPESLIHAWEHVWNSSLKRAYTFDFEYYPEGFDPEKNSTMFLYIAID